MGWHRTMSRMGKRLTRSFGTPCTLLYEDGTSVPLVAIFDLGTELDEDNENVLVEVQRAGIYREDLPLSGGVPREPKAFKDTLEIDDLEVADEIAIPVGVMTITEVRKDEGSMYMLHLRERT